MWHVEGTGKVHTGLLWIALGRLRRRYADGIKMHLQETGWGGMDWSAVAQERQVVEGAFECGNEPSGSIKCGEFRN
jgi:hypothetical protein